MTSGGSAGAWDGRVAYWTTVGDFAAAITATPKLVERFVARQKKRRPWAALVCWHLRHCKRTSLSEEHLTIRRARLSRNGVETPVSENSPTHAFVPCQSCLRNVC